MCLLLFGVHLALVGVAIVRTNGIPSWIGLLIFLAGIGYAADSAMFAVWPGSTLSLSEFLFVGEVVLLVWLIGWGGRSGILRGSSAQGF